MYVPVAQGKCQNSHQKFLKSKKRHRRRITCCTYNSTMVTNETHGQNIQIYNVVEFKMVTYRQPPSTLNISRLDLNNQSMSSMKKKPLFTYPSTCHLEDHLNSKIEIFFVVLDSSTFLTVTFLDSTKSKNSHKTLYVTTLVQLATKHR